MVVSLKLKKYSIVQTPLPKINLFGEGFGNLDVINSSKCRAGQFHEMMNIVIKYFQFQMICKVVWSDSATFNGQGHVLLAKQGSYVSYIKATAWKNWTFEEKLDIQERINAVMLKYIAIMFT